MNYMYLRAGGDDESLRAILNARNGQIVSLKRGSKEFMQGGGRDSEDSLKQLNDMRGWINNSWITMFPIVNSSKDHKILYEGKLYDLSQHGTIRVMTPEISKLSDDALNVLYNYVAGTLLDNSYKHALNNAYPKDLMLPFDCSMKKEYKLSDVFAVKTIIENTSSKSFCYAYGDHPAFVNKGDPEKCFFYSYNDWKMSLKDVKNAGDVVLKTDWIRFFNERGTEGLEVRSDCGMMQLWSPGFNVFAIEPITETLDNNIIHDLSGDGTGSYKLILKPGEKKTYNIEIRLF